MASSDPVASRPARRRKVADLNEEQKQRKRIVDRQAQQAFRERTKAQIQELEEEVETLHRQASENEDVWRHENARLQKQVQRLSQRLRQIRDLTGIPAQLSLEFEQEGSLVDSAAQTVHPATPSTRAEPMVDAVLDVAAADESPTAECFMSNAAPDVIDHGDNNDEVLTTHLPSAIQQSFSSPQDVTQDSPLASAVEIVRSLSQNEASQTNHGVEPSDDTSHVTTAYETSTATSTHPVFLPTPNSTHSIVAYLSPPVVSRRLEVYETICDHSHRTCPFDHILVSHMEAMRVDIARGEPISSAIGPPEPDIAGLFQPEKAARSHQLSRMLVEMMLTFAHVRQPERLAFMYKLHKTMRWHIAPSKETYDVLPTWLRPTTKQVLTPHAAWIDCIPWPAVRDMLVEFPDRYPFEEFSEVYSSNVTISWLHNESDIVVDLSGTHGPGQATQAVINPIFERHIRNLDNWTVNEAFRRIYPEVHAAVSSRY